MSLRLDKALYRRVYGSFKQWNEAKMLDHVESARRLTSSELWRRYASLWNLCMKIAPPQTPEQEKLRWAELDRYYANIRKLEAWRREHGRSS